ncbi:MAG TPA: co-chaperone DjlA [Steroidobacteraceae bacterium]|nr:co-chaperone DjlA [Steroidobacteraceae bacterium]
MGWIGKLIGALLGFILSRRATGVLLGLVIGHLFDQYAARGRRVPRAELAAVRATFFRTAFSVMGHVAKSDGRVSEQDIAAARSTFRQFHLNETDTRAAMQFYNEGKEPDYDVESALKELSEVCRGREEVLRMFLEIQMRAALAGDGLGGASRATLARVAGALGIGALEFAHLETLLRLQAYAGAGGPGYAGSARPGAQPRADALADAYEILGVPKTATDAEVKRAYRKLMSENHPDKLVARGLPESMLDLAKQKTQAIQAAWERVRESRGMR